VIQDGTLFFVKDKTEEIRVLTDEERNKYTKSSSTTYGFSNMTTSYKFERPKEKSIKINVKKHQ